MCRIESRFWNASGVSVKLGAGGVELQLESLRAILLGGIAFDTPEDAGPVTASAGGHEFPLFSDREAAKAASYSRKIPAVSYFAGSVRGLEAGSEVTMHGLVVGHVTDVQLVYDPAKDAIVAPVRFEVEPERILGVGAKAIFKTPADAVAAVMNRGLRASLQSASLITGQQVVALDFVHDAPPATVTMDGSDFVLPTTEGGGFRGTSGVGHCVARQGEHHSVQADRRQPRRHTAIGQRCRERSADEEGADRSFVHDRRPEQSCRTPRQRYEPRAAAIAGYRDGLQKTLTTVNKLALSLDSGYGDNTQFNRDLERLLVQVNDAIRSIRSLADLLARHPEALIKGRPAGGVE